MARRNNKAAKGAQAVTGANGDALPSFDEKALSALTSRIEQGFGKASQQSESTPQSRPKKGQAENGSSGSKSKSVVRLPEASRGTKRDAHGNAKAQGKSRSKKATGNAEGNGTVDRTALLEEILALGGTKEDLDLVADAVSDEDENVSTNGPVDKSLQKELAKFVAGLGIEGQTAGQDAESEAEDAYIGRDESEEDQEWEEASDAEFESAKIVPEAAPPPPKKAAKLSLDELSVHDPKHLIFEARPDWHAASLPGLPSEKVPNPAKFQVVISNLKAYASTLLEQDSSLYASKHLSSSSSHRFLSQIMTSGTLSDKVSALTLVVQESPVHTTKSFENLLVLAKKRSRAQAVSALGALKDLLGNGVVLPPDRRLRLFDNQPGLLSTLHEDTLTTWVVGHRLPGNITKGHLISWAYEDWLKESYFDMLKVLEGWCNDEVVYARTRAVNYVYELLKEKPEQEANLLRLLVNKLGDPDKKIASRTSYLLLQLQTSHPLMKPTIIRFIETELLLKPGQSSHAKYYAINTLNQTILRANEEEVAKKLLDIYFELFVSLLKKKEPKPEPTGLVTNRKGQIQGGGAPAGKKGKEKAQKEEDAKLASQETTEKMISAVLSGVNRAFPFSKADDISLEKHMDTLFRITHSSNFNTSIQALMLIEQLATTKHLAVERFYKTLYESLLDPRLIASSKHALYLNLLFRALRADLNIKRIKAFAKRLLQIVTLHQPPFICGVIYLIRELEITFPGLKTLLVDPEMDDEDEEEVFWDVPEDGGENVGDKSQNQKLKPTEKYDGRKRDPEHSHAEKSCLWETIPFLVHYHPSVSLFAARLVDNEKMPPKPDLASHNLSSFLDRFVYRNVKSASAAPRGTSIMQPLSGSDSKTILLSSKSNPASQQPVNTEAFWRKKVEDVAVDQVFFHKYFGQMGKTKQTSIKKKTGSKPAGEDGEEDDGEDEIWQALIESRPELEGDSDESDMEMLDLDDSDQEDDSDVDMESDDGMEINMEDDESEIDAPEADEEDALSGSEVPILDDGEDEEALFAKELQTGQSPEEEKEGKETSRKRKQRLKKLPMFASMEDYAGMLDNDEDEDF
ncbi:CBF/Mak21 family-domain-containing protein [Amylocarpus encephaloides]|uniref:CBF/Mak21 family-domain-containing protein n=1 Tax=Amylocarpus encephaloides TaxID=45428 RepID=A0A9P7YUU2_9HELO|nr:CBF/Mak21 family-domain-containing protein [Amylocarpus encephaloides]